MKIIITGGTKGLGRAIAEKFAAEGFDLAICARTEADLVAMRTEFAQRCPNCQILTQAVDVRQKEEVLAFANLIKREWNDFDVLVNNAGLFTPGNISDEPEGALENMIATNLYSAYHLTRALLPLLLKKQQGHIFNMCSIASLKAYPAGGSYSIAKFALLGFSKNLRHELMDKGIRVTSIMPGATWSASWAGVDLPEERLMQASDIALAVWAAWSMSPSAVLEDLVIRPQLGDL